jgi:hypothetical protein
LATAQRAKISLALTPVIRYNAPRATSFPGAAPLRSRRWSLGVARPDRRLPTPFWEDLLNMIRRGILIGICAGLFWVFLGNPTPAASEKIFTYDYTFKHGSEPDGFRGLKWQTDIATLDPLHTMELIAVVGPFTYYKKNKEDLRLVTVPLDDIIYEFWNGKFSGVIIKVKGQRQFQVLKDYCFARFGEGQRSKILQQMDVQDFYYNGVRTRMYLKYSDMDRIGELAMYSIALLAKQQNQDTYYLRQQAKEQIEGWEKAKGK